MKGALAGLRVLVTRPAQQAENLCRLIEAQGGKALRLPLLAIEPTAQPAKVTQILAAACDYNWWIFTSTNAVSYAQQLVVDAWPRNLAAVGAATAAALQAAGHAALSPVSGYSSENLLALPEFLELKDQRILIVTGEGGLDVLDHALAERGAKVERAEVYRRVPLPYEPALVARTLRSADVIVVTSGEALEHLLRCTPDNARKTLLGRQLAVPSARVVEQARELGFTRPPLLPEQVSDVAIVRSLEAWRGAVPQAPARKSMTETEAPSAAGSNEPGIAPQERRRATRLVFWVFVLLMLAALGYGGWYVYRFWVDTAEAVSAQDVLIRRLNREIGMLQNDTSRVSDRQDDLSQALRRNGAEIAGIGSRLDETEQTMARLSDTVQGGRSRLQLLAVEQLLLLANDRLLLAHDAAGAQKALELADQRLATLGNPRLFKVREAIAGERASLLAVPRVDATGVALKLGVLIQHADRLPLRVRVPEHFEAKPQPRTAMPAQAEWPQRLWIAVKSALSGVFALHREDGGVQQLLPPEEETLMRQILALKLEGARFALLAGDGASFRDLTAAAAAWLKQYYKPDDPGVRAAQAELERLQTLELNPALPDLGRSLTLLRAHLEASPR